LEGDRARESYSDDHTMPMKQLAARYPRIVATFQQFKTGKQSSI